MKRRFLKCLQNVRKMSAKCRLDVCFQVILGVLYLQLEGNTWELCKLDPALHIYEKYGFTEVKLADYEYERWTLLLKR